MCMVSVVMDDFTRRQRDTWVQPFVQVPEVTRLEFDALKAEVEELKKLLAAAKEYDKNTGQPDCEMEDKVALIKRIADAVGVDLSDVV